VVGSDDACNGITKLVLLGHHSSPESINGEGVDKSGNGLESLGIKSVACIVSMSGKGGPINKDGESVGGGGAGIADTETLDVVVVASGGAEVVLVLDDGKLVVEEGGKVVVVEGHGSFALVVGAEDVDGEVAAVVAGDVVADITTAVVVVAVPTWGGVADAVVVVVAVVLDNEVVVVEVGVDDVVVGGHGSLALVVGTEDVDGEVAVVGAGDVVVDITTAVVVLDNEVVVVEADVDDVVVGGHDVLVSVVVGVVGQDPAHVTGKR
jgi:hypothetical protein